MLELPSYRLPSFKNVLAQTFILTKNFVVRAGTVIFLASLLMHFLGGLQNAGYAPLTAFTDFFAQKKLAIFLLVLIIFNERSLKKYY